MADTDLGLLTENATIVAGLPPAAAVPQQPAIELEDPVLVSNIIEDESIAAEPDEEADQHERVVYTNRPDLNAANDFPSNSTKTTKYTPWNFIFKNLYEQFRRLANFYFLIVVVIQLIPGISPVTPVTSIAPLVFVLSVTAIKDGYDDYKRRQADKEYNNKKTKALRRSKLEQITFKDVVVGDILRLENNDEVPADMVLLTSSNAEGLCYIETSNLDGETNKKLRWCVPHTARLSQDALGTLQAVIFTERPNMLLNQFYGRFEFLRQPNNAHPHSSSSSSTASSSPILASDVRETHSHGAHAAADTNVDNAEDTIFPLSAEHLLLRGSRLRNTDFVYGVVVYTGSESKLVMNQQPAPSKFTHVEKRLNRYLIISFTFQIVLCTALTIGSAVWQSTYGNSMVYLDPSASDIPIGLQAVEDFLTFFILLNTFIPISLYVSLELVKFFASKFIEFDIAMYDEPSDTPCNVKTTSLLEELGQIDYIFSDKTGTLTQNLMTFRKASIAGALYAAETRRLPGMGLLVSERLLVEDLFEPFPEPAGEFAAPSLASPGSLSALPMSTPEQRAAVIEFMLAMAICNSVLTETIPRAEGDDIEYHTSSPDEEALVKGAAKFRVVLTHRTSTEISVNVLGYRRNFDLLAELPFSSERKRMSVVVRERLPGNRVGPVTLYIKGAESVVFPRLARVAVAEDVAALTTEHLTYFATRGLRTLTIAKRSVDNADFAEWLRAYRQAQAAIVGREERLAHAAAMIERDLSLMGATAIEDRLADGVAETLRDLRRAGIRVWMLTGDKQETAINIGYACNLIDSSIAKLFRVNAETSEECQALLRNLIACIDSGVLEPDEPTSTLATPPLTAVSIPSPPPSNTSDSGDGIEHGEGLGARVAMVIDGNSLVHALKDHKDLLWEAVRRCDSVICCRASPKQKALLVRLVKSHGPATLAVGDGANDVSMIQEAHVGVGIIGREGSQARLASDYAIAQFRFLKRLLLVHGRWSYVRITTLIQYSFYKNVAFTLPQVYFAFYNAFSGQTLYDAWVITIYNMFFTFLPICIYAITEKDIQDRLLERYPELYRRTQSGDDFSLGNFVAWLGYAVWHSLVIFFVSRAVFLNDVLLPNGQVFDVWSMGTLAGAITVIVVNLKIGLESNYWTGLSHFSIWGSMVSYWVFMFPYCSLVSISPNEMYGVIFMLCQSPTFWLAIVLGTAMSILPDFALKSFIIFFYPQDYQIIKEFHRERKKLLKAMRKKGERAPLLSSPKLTPRRDSSNNLTRYMRSKSQPNVKPKGKGKAPASRSASSNLVV